MELLRRAASPQGDGLRHAYLLTGPPQVGKTTLAQAFARALLCTSGEERPCGACRSCQLMRTGGHPDFRLVQPTDRQGEVDRANGLLRVEQAGQIVHDAMLRPVEGRYKFFLIQDMHRSNDSFANKLLKTLEEPPDHVVLCLTAHDASGLLPTIVSRCQVLALRPVPPTEIAAALVQRWQADPEQADVLARLAGGRVGWAVNQLTGDPQTSERETHLQTLQQLVRASRVERILQAQKLASNRNNEHLFGMLEVWSGWWRDVMLAQAGCIDACTNLDHRADIEDAAQRFAPEDVRRFLHTLARIEGYLRHTVNTGLALDVLFLQTPRPQT